MSRLSAASVMEMSDVRDNLPTMELAPLEAIPSELGLMILPHLSLYSLRALIRASPRYLALYLANRSRILPHTFHATFGPELSEILVVMGPGSRLSKASRLLGLPYSGPPPEDRPKLSNHLMLHILHVHTAHIEPLVRAFGEWALDNLEDLLPATRTGQRLLKSSDMSWWHNPELKRGPPRALSESEQADIARAVYRLLFLDYVYCKSIQVDRITPMLKTRFELWEWDAIACIREFFFDTAVADTGVSKWVKCGSPCLPDWTHRGSGLSCLTQVTLHTLYAYDEVAAGYSDYNQRPWREVQPPMAWGWRNVSVHSPGRPQWSFERSSILAWRRAGFVLWDDERMLQWAAKMGKEQRNAMGLE